MHDLTSGERLLWTGRPVPGFRLAKADRKNWAGGCVFTGFALFWTGAAFLITWAGDAPPFFRFVFPLFGLPFVAVGLMVLFGSAFRRSKNGQHTAYAITERRIIIVVEKGSREVTSFNLERLESTDLQEGSDGVGTITFTISRRDQDRLIQQQRLDALSRLSLESVAEAASVYATLEAAKARRVAEVGEIDP
ncbi:MAG: hypothetical protein IT363_09830 [Methanoregulaceae archaeon]|nr:hypothetical protein [Methanoregulaceae archaeon]